MEPDSAGECYRLAVKSSLISAARDGSSHESPRPVATLGMLRPGCVFLGLFTARAPVSTLRIVN
jgi:hypothetical protein